MLPWCTGVYISNHQRKPKKKKDGFRSVGIGYSRMNAATHHSDTSNEPDQDDIAIFNKALQRLGQKGLTDGVNHNSLYTGEDIKIIKTIINYANRFDDVGSSTAIIQAYNLVLNDYGINPEETKYFAVIMMLGKYPGTTLSEKFTFLLKDLHVYPDSTSPLGRRDMLKSAFSNWKTKRRILYFRKLIDIYQERVDYKTAIACHNKNLAKMSLSVWTSKFDGWLKCYHFMEILEGTTLRKSYWVKMRENLAYYKRLEEEAVIFRVRCLFRRWKDKLALLRKNEEEAIIYSQARICHKFLKEWVYLSCENFSTRKYNIVLQKKTINTWINKIEEFKKLESVAASFDNGKLILRFYVSWRAKYLGNKTRELLSTTRADIAFLSKYLAKWRKLTQLSEIERDIYGKKSKLIAEQTVIVWTHYTQDNIIADNLYTKNLKTHFFRQLKLEYMRSIFETYRDKKIVFLYFKIWFMMQRALLFERYHLACTAKVMIKIWKNQAILWKDVERDILINSLRKDTYKIATRFLDFWVKRTMTEMEREKYADDYYDANIFFKLWEKWKIKSEHISTMEINADENYGRHLAYKFIVSWKQKTTDHKQQRLATLCEEFIEKKTTSLVKKTIDTWRDKVRVIEINGVRAVDFYEDRIALQIKNMYCSGWYQSYIKIKDDEVTSDMYYNSFLLESFFKKWRSEYSYVIDLEEKLQGILFATDLALKQQIFRRWTMKMLKLKVELRKSEDFHERWNNEKFKSIWHTWRLIFEERKNNNKEKQYQNPPYTNPRVSALTRKIPFGSNSARRIQGKDVFTNSYTPFIRRKLIDIGTTPSRPKFFQPVSPSRQASQIQHRRELNFSAVTGSETTIASRSAAESFSEDSETETEIETPRR